MLAAAAVAFRESVEAGLVIGIILALTRGVTRRSAFVGLGVVLGIVASALAALTVGLLLTDTAFATDDLFKAFVSAAAVVMVVTHQVSSHGGAGFADAGLTSDRGQTRLGLLLMLAFIAGLTVFREGCEAILFLAALLVDMPVAQYGDVALGGVVGLILSGAVSALTYTGLVMLPARTCFLVANCMIVVVAAGMAAQCVAFLEKARAVGLGGGYLWDSSSVLPQSSGLGRVLHVLFGYMDHPTVLQVAAYAAILSLIPTIVMKGAGLMSQSLGTASTPTNVRALRNTLLTEGQIRSEVVFVGMLIIFWMLWIVA